MLELFFILLAFSEVVWCNPYPVAFGEIVEKVEYPYAAYVDVVYSVINPKTGKISKRSNTCGGTIIGTDAILTAAHCLTVGFDGEVPEVTVFVGAVKLTDFGKLGQFSTMKDFTIHPDYHNNKLVDIAIIHLRKNLRIKSGSVEIAEFGQAYLNRYATAIGWGDTEDAEDSHILRRAVLKIVRKRFCGSYFNKDDHIICAWADNRRTTLCVGDSGGPLILDGKVVGVASQVMSMNIISTNVNHEEYYFCSGERPTRFVNIRKYLEWIAENKVSS